MFDNTILLNWVILPFFIYFARIIDVSLGTMRIITLSRGQRRIAPLLGFVEMLIWLLAIRQIFNNLDNPACYLAYAAGFASGIYSGMWLENKIALGLRVVRIITRHEAKALTQSLRDKGFRVTTLDGAGESGSVNIIFTVVQRKDVPVVTRMAKQYNPKAFYSVGDVQLASEGIIRSSGGTSLFSAANFLKFEKKGN